LTDLTALMGSLGTASVAGAVVATAATFTGVRGAAVAMAALAGAAIAVHVGLRGASIALLSAGVATSALNDVRVATSVTASDALLVLAIAALVASGPRLGGTFAYGRPVVLAVGLIALGGLAASLASADPVASALNVARLVLAAGGVLLALLLWSPGRRGVFAMAWLWIASAASTSLWGLLVHQDVAGRAIGLSTHSNHLALAATMALGPALGLTTGLRGWCRLLALALVAVLAAGILSSGSRASLLGAGLVTVAFAVGRPRALLPMATAFGAVVLLALAGIVELSGSNAVARLLGLDGLGAAASDAERWLLIETALDRLEISPLIGSGFESALEAHNVYLQVWTGAGLLGFAGVALLVGTALHRYREARGIARNDRDAMVTLALGLACGWLGYLVVALFQNPLWDRYVWMPVALIVVTWPHLPRREAR